MMHRAAHKKSSGRALPIAHTLVTALFFRSGIAARSVGGVSTKGALRIPVIAVVLGLICGFTEKADSQLVANTAKSSSA